MPEDYTAYTDEALDEAEEGMASSLIAYSSKGAVDAYEAIKAEKQRRFDRMAYLNLADEFDPMGQFTHEPRIEDFDAFYVAGAERFARRHGIPLPWVVCSMDNALEYVRIAERRFDEDRAFDAAAAEATAGKWGGGL
jgi:hypothetical protein